MIGTCLSLELFELAKEETPRVLNFLPLAHMFGCGSILVLTYLGEFLLHRLLK
jgi:long-subunit acyl-CoA synthetase (AMP-forming)